MTSKPVQSILGGNSLVPPEDRASLVDELNHSVLLGRLKNDIDIYLSEYHENSVLMREIGRLREFSFCAVGEGTGKDYDLDEYDQYYLHLILWDARAQEIAGAYRIGRADTIISAKGINGLYSSSLFEYDKPTQQLLANGLELGRSFVQPSYWGKRSLDYLWYGIGAFLKSNQQYRYLFGAVSISNSYPQLARGIILYFYSHYFYKKESNVKPRLPYSYDQKIEAFCQQLFLHDDKVKDFKILKNQLKNMQLIVPTLYKQYTELVEEGGCCFLGFNVDPNFSHCIDGLVLVDIQKIKAKKRERYIDSHR